eukprot:360672-Chlamydomonas_euryale.AAC.1
MPIELTPSAAAAVGDSCCAVKLTRGLAMPVATTAAAVTGCSSATAKPLAVAVMTVVLSAPGAPHSASGSLRRNDRELDVHGLSGMSGAASACSRRSICEAQDRSVGAGVGDTGYGPLVWKLGPGRSCGRAGSAVLET